MDGTETRQRRAEELGLPYTLSTGRLPRASEDGPLSVPESQRVSPKLLGTELSRETALSIGLQVIVPFMFAGLGLSGAGILLNYFQHWPVFMEVKDLLTLVPPLVGLKGNLEMTLASRLSTAETANGHIESLGAHSAVWSRQEGRACWLCVLDMCSSVLHLVPLFLRGSLRPILDKWMIPGSSTESSPVTSPSFSPLKTPVRSQFQPDARYSSLVPGMCCWGCPCCNFVFRCLPSPLEVQATVVGFLAAMAALLLGALSRGELDFEKVELLCASSVITAFLAAFALGMLMVCIVIGARKLGVNPDNIATPIAASLGDLITLSILAFFSSFFYKHKDSRYVAPLVCIGLMALTPVWVLTAKRSPPIMEILKFGWFPIILAMMISSFGGLILNKTISKEQYKGMAIFTPIICGVGGNLVAIQTSRISTYLHMWSTPGVLPLWMKKFWPNPCSTFCTSEINSMSARVLLFLVIPGHLIFLYVIYLVEGHSVPNSKTFVVFYLLAGLIQVTILLYLAEVMARLTWHQSLDPDNHCIPYLTGLGDLLGTGLLALCFLISWLLRSEAELDGILEPASAPP
uniref:Solute carrier family 41 member n=1 Tax=Rhinolophus ferrumequinum TaxID=59479 RepID=A0A671EKX5_RHIFE